MSEHAVVHEFACLNLGLEQDLTSHGTKRKRSVHRILILTTLIKAKSPHFLIRTFEPSVKDEPSVDSRQGTLRDVIRDIVQPPRLVTCFVTLVVCRETNSDAKFF